MKNRLVMAFTAALLTATMPVMAILPPLYHTIAEIQGMLSSPDMTRALESGEPIMSITHIEEGYRISSLHHQIDVTVTSVNQNRPGPAKFKYSFGTPVAIESNDSAQ